MNIIKNLFTDLENLLNLLNNFDYTKLILLTIMLAIIYLINIILVNKYERNASVSDSVSNAAAMIQDSVQHSPGFDIRVLPAQ